MIQSIPSAAGSAPGGAVGGASNLTTAGAVPYVASPGVLTQDATALFWNATSYRITLGNAMAGTGLATRAEFSHASVFGTNSYALLQSSGGQTTVNTATGQPLYFTANNSVIGMFAANTGNLLLGTTTDGGRKLEVLGDVKLGADANWSSIRLGVAHITAAGGSTYSPEIGGGSDSSIYTVMRFSTSAAERMRINGNGNILIGTTTDGNYKLDIAASGSSGTLRVYDSTATVGTTSLVVRAGAGQSGNLFTLQNNGGTQLVGLDQFGVFSVADSVLVGSVKMISSGYVAANTAYYYFSSTSSPGGSPDTGIYRNAAGVLEINNGTAGTLRDLLLRYLRNTGVTVATLPAAAAGNAGSRAYVTDANATTIGSTVAGGGSNKVMVWSDGTNWKIYAS